MKVLIIEDSAIMRDILKNCIEAAGLEYVGEAEDGTEGINKYKELQPDLVLLDISMPNMNGLEWLEEIKKIDDNVAVIVCSALGHRSVLLEAIKLGVKDYVTKPFLEEELVLKLQSISNSNNEKNE